MINKIMLFVMFLVLAGVSQAQDYPPIPEDACGDYGECAQGKYCDNTTWTCKTDTRKGSNPLRLVSLDKCDWNCGYLPGGEYVFCKPGSVDCNNDSNNCGAVGHVCSAVGANVGCYNGTCWICPPDMECIDAGGGQTAVKPRLSAFVLRSKYNDVTYTLKRF